MTIVQLTTDNRQAFRQYDNPEPWFGPAPESLLQGFAQLPEAEVHVVTCTQRPMRAPEKLAENMWFHSLHVPKIGWMRTAYQGCVRAMRRKIHEIAPDIVHGQGTERECSLGAVFSGFPNVVTIHGNMAAVVHHQETTFARVFGHCASFLEAVALRRTGGVFCNSAYTESLVARHAKRTWRVPNPIRQAFFKPAGGQPIAQPPVLLNIGVITPRKNQVALLDVARDLHAAGHRFVFHFIGGLEEGTDYSRTFCEKMAVAREAGYADHLGTFEIDPLIDRMDSASALVHVPDEEAFGLVIAEALARNLKLFATKTGGIIDIASGVEGAQLFESKNWTSSLKEAIGHWLQSGAPRPHDAAIKMAARYQPVTIARRHLDIYREVLNRPTQRTPNPNQ